MPPEISIEEMLQLAMGACLLDNGDIWCLNCDRPNECCICDDMSEHDLHTFTDDYTEAEAQHARIGYEDDRDLTDYLLDENLDMINRNKEPESFKTAEIKVDGCPVDFVDVEEAYCDKCGRSKQLCDCDTKDIP
jgi:hypothetical protein